MASLKSNKKRFAKEVASMKSVEVFGIETCGATWNKLLRKHLAFELIECGKADCDDTCLFNEINEDCGC